MKNLQQDWTTLNRYHYSYIWKVNSVIKTFWLKMQLSQIVSAAYYSKFHMVKGSHRTYYYSRIEKKGGHLTTH